MPASPTTSPSQLPASARRRAERLVKLYEREAYRIYNLALRITCERDAAARATETAFLRYVAETGGDEESKGASLVEQTVGAARALAPRAKGVERGEEDPLLEAASSLAPAERAAIALISVGTSSVKGIATAMGTTEDVAEPLVKEARSSLGSEIGVAANRVGPKLRDWTWAEPPEEIWESVYPQAQRLLVEREQAGPEAPAQSKTAASAKAPSKGKAAAKGKAKAQRRAPVRPARDSALASRLLRDAPSLWSRIGHSFSGRVGIWAFRISVLVIILTPAAVIALASTGGKSGSTLALSGPGQAGSAVAGSADTSQGGSTYNALTPKELDQLRLRELDQLREYSQQQADQSLSASQRSDAASKAEQLLATARERLAAVEQREQQVAAKEQQQSQAKTPAPAATPAPQPAAPAPAGTTPPKKKKKHKKKQAATQPSNSLDNCLFNPDTGTYICPEQ
jgi:hypothetical protein